MNRVEEYDQKRNDFDNIYVKNTTLSGLEKFNCKKCKDLCASLTHIQEYMIEDRYSKYCDKTFASRTQKLSHKKYM